MLKTREEWQARFQEYTNDTDNDFVLQKLSINKLRLDGCPEEFIAAIENFRKTNIENFRKTKTETLTILGIRELSYSERLMKG